MKMLQVRNVPDELHRALKARAAHEGTTMSELVLRELPRIASRPSMEQWLERVSKLPPTGGRPVTEVIAQDRAERDARR